MLTLETILRVIRSGGGEPHYFGQTYIPRWPVYREQTPIGPDSLIRIWNESLGAHFIVRAPYVGEEKQD